VPDAVRLSIYAESHRANHSSIAEPEGLIIHLQLGGTLQAARSRAHRCFCRHGQPRARGTRHLRSCIYDLVARDFGVTVPRQAAEAVADRRGD
jgi:hypothetical protein